MAAIPRQNANTAFQTSANAFATTAVTVARPRRTPVARPKRTPAPAPAVRPRQSEQSLRMLLMIFAAAVVVLCGVAYLWGQASLTYEGYRHSRLQKMLIQERAMEQQWRHEQAAQSAPSSIEQKAKEQGMVKAAESDVITAGAPLPPAAPNGHSDHL